ncbi:MAG: hypothetical protein MI975_09185 [Cytophagales bacterium]|nr:hypothetical protein [Cytophagales bacterium]
MSNASCQLKPAVGSCKTPASFHVKNQISPVYSTPQNDITRMSDLNRHLLFTANKCAKPDFGFPDRKAYEMAHKTGLFLYTFVQHIRL